EGVPGLGGRQSTPVLGASSVDRGNGGAFRGSGWDDGQGRPVGAAGGSEPVQVREPVEEDLGLANVILPNGARYYVDHAHPEYSTPECLTPRELVVHDKAGERILERSLHEIDDAMPLQHRLAGYKNNSDGKGNSYGTHENYLVD